MCFNCPTTDECHVCVCEKPDSIGSMIYVCDECESKGHSNTIKWHCEKCCTDMQKNWLSSPTWNKDLR